MFSITHCVHKVEFVLDTHVVQIEVDGRGAQRGAPRSHHNNDKDDHVQAQRTQNRFVNYDNRIFA